MNELQVQFEKYISSENLFRRDDQLLIAVSGGLDSVTLCELCFQGGYHFMIAHCNFQLRGLESDRDERFVSELAKKYGKEFITKRFETERYAQEEKVSMQVAARRLRYRWFDEIAGIHFILTAHHLNDSVESLLLNFFKGTGIAGLHGILPKQGKLVRPLLFAKKEDLREFAVIANLTWVEDSSNQSVKYTRNFLRLNVLPELQKYFPALIDNLAQNIQRFKEVELLYDQSISQYKSSLTEKRANEIQIPILKLKKVRPLNTIVYEIIKDYNFSAAQIQDVVHLMSAGTGKCVYSPSHQIFRNRHWLVVAPRQDPSSETVVIESTGQWSFARGIIVVGLAWELQTVVYADDTKIHIDAEKIRFPLLLRRWRVGDYFYPLGMSKKKKLSRFFIDSKLSKTDKARIWVLESDKKIVWVVGYRIDDRLKITEHTKKILEIEVRMS